jgi:hypothetical protein
MVSLTPFPGPSMTLQRNHMAILSRSLPRKSPRPITPPPDIPLLFHPKQIAAWVPHPPLSLTVPSTKETPSSVSGTATNHKVNETSSPSAPSSRRTPNITVEYFKPLRQPIKRLPRKAEVYATAAKDPFVPSTQALGPHSSRNASKPSRSQQKATLFVLPTHSQTNRVNLADLYPVLIQMLFLVPVLRLP